MEGHDPKKPGQLRKLFTGGLGFEATDDSLREHFEKWGTHTDCEVMRDYPYKMFQRFCFCDLLLCRRGGCCNVCLATHVDGCVVEPKISFPA